MDERAHLSIGEVLSLLRDEFPDVTISKIRFLESQGLLDPERTPSGYRKFYEEDVERLRWILRQQRENFLPLKVIKGRLTDQTNGSGDDAAAFADHEDSRSRSSTSAAGRTGDAPAAPGEAPGAPGMAPSRTGTAAGVASVSGLTSPRPGIASAGRGNIPQGPATSAGSARPDYPSTGSPPVPVPPPDLPPAPSGGGYTRDDLASATGLSEDAVAELVRFGLIAGRDLGGTTYFDQNAASIAALAAGFARHGVEARHLRMYKNAAERESALFEQVVMPLLKQRNPQARQQAAAALEDLGQLSAELRRALLRQALDNTF